MNKKLKILLGIVLCFTVLLSILVLPASALTELDPVVAASSDVEPIPSSLEGYWIFNKTIDLSYFGDITNLAYSTSSNCSPNVPFDILDRSDAILSFTGMRAFSGQNMSTDTIVYNHQGWTDPIYRFLYFDFVDVSPDFYIWLSLNATFVGYDDLVVPGGFLLPQTLYFNKTVDWSYFTDSSDVAFNFAIDPSFGIFESNGNLFTGIGKYILLPSIGTYSFPVYSNGSWIDPAYRKIEFNDPCGVDSLTFLFFFDNCTFAHSDGMILDGTFYFNETLDFSYLPLDGPYFCYYFGAPLENPCMFDTSGYTFTGFGFMNSSLGTISVPVYDVEFLWYDDSFRFITFDSVFVPLEIYLFIDQNTTRSDDTPQGSIYDDGYSAGFDVGFRKGHFEGVNEGYDKGYKDGLNASLGLAESQVFFDEFLTNLIDGTIDGFDEIILYKGEDLSGRSTTISLWSIFSAVLVVCIALFVIKRFFIS